MEYSQTNTFLLKKANYNSGLSSNMNKVADICWTSLDVWYGPKYASILTLFFPMFSFDPPENIRKPKFF